MCKNAEFHRNAGTRAQSTHVFHQERSSGSWQSRVEGGLPEPYFTTACHGAKINVLRIECVFVLEPERPKRANVIKAAFIGHIRRDLDRRSAITFRQSYTTRIAQNDWKQLRRERIIHIGEWLAIFPPHNLPISIAREIHRDANIASYVYI